MTIKFKEKNIRECLINLFITSARGKQKLRKAPKVFEQVTTDAQKAMLDKMDSDQKEREEKMKIEIVMCSVVLCSVVLCSLV